MNFLLSGETSKKLKTKHGVSEAEVLECFCNRTGPFLEDTRERYRTIPPTKWFIATTDSGRLLKVVFIFYRIEKEIVIKTAFEPNQIEIELYRARKISGNEKQEEKPGEKTDNHDRQIKYEKLLLIKLVVGTLIYQCCLVLHCRFLTFSY